MDELARGEFQAGYLGTIDHPVLRPRSNGEQPGPLGTLTATENILGGDP